MKHFNIRSLRIKRLIKRLTMYKSFDIKRFLQNIQVHTRIKGPLNHFYFRRTISNSSLSSGTNIAFKHSNNCLKKDE